jgi:hypothetical protein
MQAGGEIIWSLVTGKSNPQSSFIVQSPHFDTISFADSFRDAQLTNS